MIIIAEDKYFNIASFVLKYFNIFESEHVSSIEIEEDNIETGFHGFCECLDGKIFISLNDELSEKEAVSTLIHEMVHAVQFARGDLRFEGKTKFWKGEEVNVSYKEEPWEQEAYELETRLHKEYISAI